MITIEAGLIGCILILMLPSEHRTFNFFVAIGLLLVW